MDQSELREDGAPPSKTTDSPKAQRPAPGPSCVSFKSDLSMDLDINFKREDGPQTHQKPDSSGPGPSCESFRSDRSMGRIIDLKSQSSIKSLLKHKRRSRIQKAEGGSSCESFRSDRSMEEPGNTTKIEGSEVISDQHQTQLDSIFMLLEENIFTFVEKELKKLHKVLSTDYPECLEHLKDEDEEQRSSSEAFLKITLNFLRRMKQKELAERLWSRSSSAVCQSKLKSDLQQKFECVFEGITKAGNPTLLKQIYTELYITEGGASEVNQEHEVRLIETTSRKPDRPETAITCEDIFKGPADTDGPIRTVLTKGVAGIGKTVLTQKFSLDWAEGRSNRDVQLLFPFTFRELNVLRDRQFSLVGLLHHFFSQSAGLCSFEQLQVLFIFDGLDECRLPLDFTKTQVLTEATESSSVDVLLVNLIRGSLLPNARLWITTRPAAAHQIPAECVSMVTEVRGFTDPQKEQYFRKRFGDRADTIVSHIRTSRSLHIMCHIPVFCWILSTVLENILKTEEVQELPRTLTQMYIHFLVVQLKRKNVKYNEKPEAATAWNPQNKKMVESLGKLAFEQLQKGNLIFYESDLSECGLDDAEASVYSGVFTQVFREEPGLYQDQVYCFVHLSVQEFLAALHVHQTFFNSGVNLLSVEQSWWAEVLGKSPGLYQSAVDQALQSPNGHLDLVLRFLLGLSLESNQSLLRGLLTHPGSSSENNQKTAEFIKKKISEGLPPEKSLNLFHCLNELNERSLLEQIQVSLRSGRLDSEQMSPAQWSALVFILLSSETDLEVFELKKYSASEEALLRLLPVVKASNKALLDTCNLSQTSCDLVYSVLSSSLSLRLLDLSNNDLQDSGLELLCSGLSSTRCRLETLRLSGCQISEQGCTFLASALNSNPSHLRELDLSYNHPGASGAELLWALQKDPRCRLEALRLDPCGHQWLEPGLRKYFCELSWDLNSAHQNLQITDGSRTMVSVDEEQPRPDLPERFDWFYQLLCSEALTGRRYFEVDFSGRVHVAVSYKGIQRKGSGSDALLGGNEQSWCLFCSDSAFSVWHNNKETVVPQTSSSRSKRVGVYVDSEAGSLSFYSVQLDKLIHLHSFSAAFTEPLFAAFGFRFRSPGSGVSLCSPVKDQDRDQDRDQDQDQDQGQN